MTAFDQISAGLCRVRNQPCITETRASVDIQQGMQGMQGWAGAYAGKYIFRVCRAANVFSLAWDGLTLHTLHTLLKVTTSKGFNAAGLLLNPA